MQSVRPWAGHAEGTSPSDVPAGARGLRWPDRAESLLVAGLASVLFVLGFGGGWGRLSGPLGGGDLLPAYATARLWAEGAPFGSDTFGFPFGMQLRDYPTADVLQNLVAGLVTRATGNPFVGINLVFAASFPITAIAALWVFRVAGMRPPMRVLAALALTFIPFHWYRVVHVYLGSMYSLVLGVGLALLIGNGTVQWRLRSRSRVRFGGFLLVLALVIGASGIYYACFTVLLCVAALVYRGARGATWRDLGVGLLPALAVAAVLGAFLVPSFLYGRAHPPLEPVAQRLVVESVQYSGALIFTFLPAPISRIPGFGPLNDLVSGVASAGSNYPWSGVLYNTSYMPTGWYSDFGSVLTVAALVVVGVGGFVLVRRSARLLESGSTAPIPRRRDPSVVSPGLLVTLLVATLLFFVPWGLNYLFAYLISPQLRGWDRLLPVLYILLFIAAELVLQRLGTRLTGRWAVGAAALALLVLVFDSVLPYRLVFGTASANGRAISDAGYAYAARLNAAVPGRCGVLELPFVAYPEAPPKVGLQNYEPLWPALTNPGKRWSAGAMRGTLASAWQARLGDAVQDSDIAPLEAAGFCAVHVDTRGYAEDDVRRITGRLEQLLGAPVAQGLDGHWLAYALPDPVAQARTPAQLSRTAGESGVFFGPPRVTPAAGAPAEPEQAELQSRWWVAGSSAEFTIRSMKGGPAFTTVAGGLLGGACGDQIVAVQLRSGNGAVTRSLRLDSRQQTSFEISLDAPTEEATLTLRTAAPACAERSMPGAVALVDPRAVR